MTLEDLANYKGEWVTPASTTYHDRIQRVRDAGAIAGMGHRRSDERTRRVRADLVSGQDARLARTREPAVLARADRDEESRCTATSTAHNADPNAVPVPLEMLTSKVARRVALRQGRIRIARAATGSRERRRRRHRRHDLSGCRGPVGKHGVVDQQQLLGVGLRASPSRAMDSFCTTAAGCSRSIRRART